MKQSVELRTICYLLHNFPKEKIKMIKKTSLISIYIFMLIGCQEKIDQTIEIKDWPYVEDLLIMEGQSAEIIISTSQFSFTPIRLKNIDAHEFQIIYKDNIFTNHQKKDNSGVESWSNPITIYLKEYPTIVDGNIRNINTEEAFDMKWHSGLTISIFNNVKHPNKFYIVYHRSYINAFSYNTHDDEKMEFIFEGFEALKAIRSNDLTTFESGIESLLHPQSSYIFSLEEQKQELEYVLVTSQNDWIKTLAKKTLNELN